MRTAVVTGSASGIGRAVRERLEQDGWRVVGVDRREAEVLADLATGLGRDEMVSAVTERCGGVLDAVVACAGVSGRTNPAELVVRLDHFGAVATLDRLRPLLARRPGAAAVAISSNAAVTAPIDEVGLVACLDDDEDAAATHAYGSGVVAYATAKRALAIWARRASVTDEWIGAGVRLNVVAPGLVVTPMTEGQLPELLASPRTVRPTAEPGRPEEIAGLVAYLLSPEARYLVGAFVVIDGGTTAAVRPEP